MSRHSTLAEMSSSVPSVNTSSVYPLPPMRYISLYTDDNIASNVSPNPPKPISDGQYSMFGQTIAIDDAIIRSLESQGLRRLYPREYDHRRELKKINASILVNFLDILDVLVRCPETNKREEKCNDIQLLFITMHHLINELRPHQARESIRVTMQSQKRQRLETTTRLNKQIERVGDIISSAINSITHYNGSTRFTDNNSATLGLHSFIDSNIDNNDMDNKDNINNKSNDSFDNLVNIIDNNYELDALMCNFVDEI